MELVTGRSGSLPFCWMKQRYSRVSGCPCARQGAASQVLESIVATCSTITGTTDLCAGAILSFSQHGRPGASPLSLQGMPGNGLARRAVHLQINLIVPGVRARDRLRLGMPPSATIGVCTWRRVAAWHIAERA